MKKKDCKGNHNFTVQQRENVDLKIKILCNFLNIIKSLRISLNK